MIIIKQLHVLQEFVSRQRASGLVSGFVPTMGALHAGHLDLVSFSRSQCGLTVVSIFVNPTQFNDPGDYKKYPQTLEKDIRLLEQSLADVLFLPEADVLYPGGYGELETYQLGYLETILEGKFRPGHFQGVCQVMSRLLKLVCPDKLFMGQKDYQQCMVVRKLLEYLDCNIELIKCPTVREFDGLAMSSRNMRLTSAQRAIAPLIFKTLKEAAGNIGAVNFADIRQQAITTLEQHGFRPDYFEIADAATLEPATQAGDGQLVLLVAAFLGEIRLIDNLLTA
ncbi:MAG: pantoate--beta-alanine ligase [Chitinophagaceae bacterium]|nr:pantoate--beta-alanine ligase [Chitinophagaceae bacterium]